MKYLILFLITVTGIILSCNHEQKKSSGITTQEETTMLFDNNDRSQNGVCYSRVTDKDTIFLKLLKIQSTVTGNLIYKINEKDRNKGIIDGQLNGDTLIADYRFMSEGIQSTRQVIFLLKDNSAIEGYGPMREKDGEIVFRDLKEVNFNVGTILEKINCPTRNNE